MAGKDKGTDQYRDNVVQDPVPFQRQFVIREWNKE